MPTDCQSGLALARKLLKQAVMKNTKNSKFVDKCAARLHYERRGVELYEIVLQKCPEELRSKFEKIKREEQSHVDMLHEVMEQFGANPFALTPSAKVTEIELRGIMKAVRKSEFHELMESVLSAELVDTVNWELLMFMARKIGEPEIAHKFEKALNDEARHLKFIHNYMLKEMTGSTRVPSKKAA
jgi:tRNA isopentenyl-2-thiomethyl-A-37 hydroxylase MiaE